MAAATDQQIQTFVNERLRPRAEQIRALLLAVEDDLAVIGDVQATIEAGSKWADTRTDGPPCLISGKEVLIFTGFLRDVQKCIREHAELATVLRACVRAPG